MSAAPSTAYWTIGIYKGTPADVWTIVGSAVSSINNTSVTWTIESGAIGVVIDRSTHGGLRLLATKVSTPGGLSSIIQVLYRLVLT